MDERSDLGFSLMASHVPGITGSIVQSGIIPSEGAKNSKNQEN